MIKKCHMTTRPTIRTRCRTSSAYLSSFRFPHFFPNPCAGVDCLRENLLRKGSPISPSDATADPQQAKTNATFAGIDACFAETVRHIEDFKFKPYVRPDWTRSLEASAAVGGGKSRAFFAILQRARPEVGRRRNHIFLRRSRCRTSAVVSVSLNNKPGTPCDHVFVVDAVFILPSTNFPQQAAQRQLQQPQQGSYQAQAPKPSYRR